MSIFFPCSYRTGAYKSQLHASVILSQDVKSFSVLFAEIADAYYEKQLWADAKPIYELLGMDSEVSICIALQFNVLKLTIQTSSLYILLQTAACRQMVEELQEAAEVYEHSKSVRFIYEYIPIVLLSQEN